MKKIFKELYVMYHVTAPIMKIVFGRLYVFRDCPDIAILELYYQFKQPFDNLTGEEFSDFSKIRKQIFEEYSLRKRQRDKLRSNRKYF
jgi:hypothetical protein